MKNYLLITLFTFSLSTVSNAATLAVNSHTCKKMQGKEEPFILVLKRGEDVNTALLRCAQDAKLPSASISALGALKNATLRYFNAVKKHYQDKQVGENLEIVSMPGNITKLDGNYYAHIHVALANDNYQIIGGHLKKATVGATTEITIFPMKSYLSRTKNEAIGLNIINTQNKM